MTPQEEFKLRREDEECFEGGTEQSPRAREIFRKLTGEDDRNPYLVHEKLARVHERYDKFDELMKAYSDNVHNFNITGAVNTIIEFREDIRKRGLTHYFLIINALNDSFAHIAIEIAQSGGRTR